MRSGHVWTDEEREVFNLLAHSDPRPRGAYGNTQIIKTIAQASGITEKTVRYVVLGYLYLVYQALAQGKEINLCQIGKLYFRFRKGRAMPEGGARRLAGFQPDKVYLKFQLSQILKKDIKKLDPKAVKWRPARGFDNRGLKALEEYRAKQKAARTSENSVASS